MSTKEDYMFKRAVFFCITVSLLIFPALAYSQELIFDYGPLSGSLGNSNWTNQQSSQNFAEQFSFSTTTTITRVDIFTGTNSPGSSVHIKVLSDASGSPGAYLYEEDQIPASWTLDPGGVYRVTCNLTTPFIAQANTVYWIGVAGNFPGMTQASVLSPGDGEMAQFNGSTFVYFTTGVGDMMFQLYGDQSQIAVPSMTQWGMILFIVFAGFGAAYYLRRQRKANN
jgi:hypothetical protein